LLFVLRDQGVDIVSAEASVLKSMSVDCIDEAQWESLKRSSPELIVFDIDSQDELAPRPSSYSYIEGRDFFSALYQTKAVEANSADLRLARVALEYLNKALKLYLRLLRERLLSGASLTASEHFSLGIVFLNHQARVVGINEVGRSLINKSDLVLENHKLRLTDAGQNNKLSILIDGAMGHITDETLPENGFMRVACAENTDLQLMIVPYKNLENAERVYHCSIGCIVFLNNPNDKTQSLLHAVSKLYDLTPKQTSVCEGLLAHKTMQQIADDLHISADGAKYHLREIFIKTGVNRQSELVSLILTSVAGLSG